MNEAGHAFVAYEYKDAVVDIRHASCYIDGYASFGWQIDENRGIVEHSGGAVLHMKRNRKIINRVELTRLQRQFEADMAEIKSLEGSGQSRATIYALVVGLLGTAFMAGSVFAVTAQPPNIWLCVLLAIPAFVGWGMALPVYRCFLQKRTAEVEPLIEAKYDEIYGLFEKGNCLLNE